MHITVVGSWCCCRWRRWPRWRNKHARSWARTRGGGGGDRSPSNRPRTAAGYGVASWYTDTGCSSWTATWCCTPSTETIAAPAPVAREWQKPAARSRPCASNRDPRTIPMTITMAMVVRMLLMASSCTRTDEWRTNNNQESHWHCLGCRQFWYETASYSYRHPHSTRAVVGIGALALAIATGATGRPVAALSDGETATTLSECSSWWWSLIAGVHLARWWRCWWWLCFELPLMVAL